MGGTTLAGGLNPAVGKFEARKPVFFFLNCPPPLKKQNKNKNTTKNNKTYTQLHLSLNDGGHWGTHEKKERKEICQSAMILYVLLIWLKFLHFLVSEV